MTQPINQPFGQPLIPQNVNIPINQTVGQPLIPQNVNIPINQTVGQPLIPQNVNTPVNSSVDNLEQRYKILTEGTNPFTSAKAEGTENQVVYQFQDAIVSGFG
ncbi:26409_t:CDS:1, partial [Racocetra persica]